MIKKGVFSHDAQCSRVYIHLLLRSIYRVPLASSPRLFLYMLWKITNHTLSNNGVNACTSYGVLSAWFLRCVFGTVWKIGSSSKLTTAQQLTESEKIHSPRFRVHFEMEMSIIQKHCFLVVSCFPEVCEESQELLNTEHKICGTMRSATLIAHVCVQTWSVDCI